WTAAPISHLCGSSIFQDRVTWRPDPIHPPPRNRQLLLTVYKRAYIVPLEYLEEHHDRAEIRPFAGNARTAHPQDSRPRTDARMGDHAGILNGGTPCFANYFIGCARACGAGKSNARWTPKCASI